MPVASLDHLLWAVPDLHAGVRQLADLTGVTPRYGGAHAGLGTANYLVGLEDADGTPMRSYLEVIGPDPEQDAPPEELPFDVGQVSRPSLHTWAVRPEPFDDVVTSAARARLDLGQVRSMSRLAPGGATLRWRLTSRSPLPLGGVQPFLIDWQDSPHPSGNDLPRLALLGLSATAPDAAGVRAALDVLGVDLPVSPGGAFGLHATLRTPRGLVELTTVR